MGVSKNRGSPKWMVTIMENPIKTDDLGGFPIFFGTTQMMVHCFFFEDCLLGVSLEFQNPT